jgi:carboxypeptidase family protein
MLKVIARQTTTNVDKSATADSNGRFRFPYLQVGNYEVTVHQAGFQETTRTVTLSLGAAFDLPIVLSVGAARATINVDAEAPLLEADRSRIAATITQNETENLPFNGRSFLDLALLVLAFRRPTQPQISSLQRPPRLLGRESPSAVRGTFPIASSSTGSLRMTMPQGWCRLRLG